MAGLLVMSRLLILVQARMESTRFPGKVLAPLMGQPLLLWLLDRLSRVPIPHALVVAMPDTPANRPVQACCTRHGYECVAVPGDPNDVLQRFVTVAGFHQPEMIVRVCGDCVFVDPHLVAQMVAYHRQTGADHTAMALEYGDGLDLDVFTHDALKRAQISTTVPSEREHVGTAFLMHPDQYHLETFPCPFDLSWLRLSVDTQADLDLVARVCARVVQCGYHLEDLTWRDLMVVCTHPPFQSRMQARPMNHAYVEQVAHERDESVRSWAALRNPAAQQEWADDRFGGER